MKKNAFSKLKIFQSRLRVATNVKQRDPRSRRYELGKSPVCHSPPWSILTRKKCVRLTGHLDIIIAVDLDVKSRLGKRFLVGCTTNESKVDIVRRKKEK